MDMFSFIELDLFHVLTPLAATLGLQLVLALPSGDTETWENSTATKIAKLIIIHYSL